jgi:heme-degrading monooxygenase HmoA
VIAVIFEVVPDPAGKQEYFDTAAALRGELEQIDGFISVERFRSLTDETRYLSLSFWRDESAIRTWRQVDAHRSAQSRGRSALFRDYRLRVANVIRDYGKTDREQAPEDSRQVHKQSANHPSHGFDRPSGNPGSET